MFPFFAFAPADPCSYAARIWPEVPAAFFFVEAVRGVRQRSPQRWIPTMFGMTLLKLRFILIAIPLLLQSRCGPQTDCSLPLAVGFRCRAPWLISGQSDECSFVARAVAGPTAHLRDRIVRIDR